MSSNLDRLISLRKKIFEKQKYTQYAKTLDKMMIPEEFDVNDCIPAIFNSKEYELINRYEIGEYRKLYEKMKSEIIDLPISNSPIIVVHPFYPILRHANFLALDEKYLDKYIEYEQRMMDLLKNSSNDIVLFESPDSFARYTYSFLEYNRIKKIILTCHSFGHVLDKKDLESLNFTDAMIAGCYKGHCIEDVEKQLTKVRIKEMNGLIMERFK